MQNGPTIEPRSHAQHAPESQPERISAGFAASNTDQTHRAVLKRAYSLSETDQRKDAPGPPSDRRGI
jgi:hypothetical protein